jgi:predicted DNA-binding antitoxin AbrB/MazE fold protein
MVTKTFEAIYDGKVLRPTKPLELEPNTSVRVTIEAPRVKRTKKKFFLDVIESLKVEAPPDWSENIEEYLQVSE